MRPTTLVRLALAGSRTDTLRVVLTAVAATLATLVALAAATVVAIPELVPEQPGMLAWNERYASALLREPGLRPGVALALIMLGIPVLALAAQCGRLGAPARDRRLAAVRLAGATPRQAVALVCAETGVASALGVALGYAVYLAGRRLLHRPDAAGRLLLPTDVFPPAWMLALIATGLPLAAAGVAVLALRRVAITPFGVVRQVRQRPPRPWPGLLIVPGVAAFAVLSPGLRYAGRHDLHVPEWILPTLLFTGGLAGVVGVVLGTGWIAYTAGRLLHRRARRPGTLLAARRLMADPWSGSRVFAALLACVLVGGGAAGVRALLTAEVGVRAELDRWTAAQYGESYEPTPGDSFYLDTMDLVDAAVLLGVVVAAAGLLAGLAEGIVSRRRTYAALVATGVPRAAIVRALLWQVFAPVVPAVLVALAVGGSMARLLGGESRAGGGTIETGCASDSVGGAEQCTTIQVPEFVREVAIPFVDLAVLGGVALAAIGAVTAVSLLFLPASTSTEELRTA